MESSICDTNKEYLMEALHNETCFGAFCRKLRGGIP